MQILLVGLWAVAVAGFQHGPLRSHTLRAVSDPPPSHTGKAPPHGQPHSNIVACTRSRWPLACGWTVIILLPWAQPAKATLQNMLRESAPWLYPSRQFA